MRNPTDLMRTILTNETAQRIIDFVSPIYGNSYVALWIFQAIGVVMGDAYKIGSDLKYETSPMTSTQLLDYWEAHYGIKKDSSLTVEQRRMRIITKIQSRGPCNPAKLAAAVSSALGGVKVDIVENVAKNTFRVIIRESVGDITPAVAVIERMKPAHLIYQIGIVEQVVSDADLQLAIAITHSESYKVEVQ